ncbi:glycosyl transferase family 2 [Flavobacterium sp. 90]|uniref:glycosyltransferase family 2 protein n=1 Tax=unclassified Flavobacterium TaxID=196869 RepID=UPI000EB0790F|nr:MULTISPECIES: glycosyltransferase family A protein [unclassified Flavobacterium]RKR08682.1 glycosyl transferase family 2 [Flavobacterium sp. 81]TCK52469.1 glycosyl transferase family 2 [Flavobacterium sp. 90]
MQNSPLVSVICMCYNHEKYVVQSLNSVLNQTYKNIQIIIANDSSTDDSDNAIKNWLLTHSDIAYINNTINLGNTKTFNKALKLAKGDYIIDLAADDVLLENCIEKQLNTFINSKFDNVGIVYGNAELISENNSHNGYYYEVNSNKEVIEKPASGDIYLSMLSQNSKICSVSSMIKRTVLDNLNGYDENLAYEDLDLWIRASRLYNFDFTDSILVQKRELENSLGSQFFKKLNPRTRKINRSTYLVIKKAIALNETKKENRALLKRLHFEMDKSFQTYDFILLLKYIPLEIKLRF